MTDKELKKILKLLDEAYKGVEEYSQTLEDTGVITEPLDKIYTMISKKCN